MRPTLLLIPGLLNDREIWADVIAGLKGVDVEVHVADVSSSETVREAAKAAWRLVQDIAPDGPLVLTGFSMGGYIALEMLVRPQGRVDATVLVSTSARSDTPEGIRLREKSIQALEADFSAAIERVVKWGLGVPNHVLAERLRHMMQRVGANAAVRQTRSVMGRRDQRANLPSLALPVQVVCGESDRITPPELSQEMAALLPHATLNLIPGAGHMLPLEQPVAIVTALQAALSSRMTAK